MAIQIVPLDELLDSADHAFPSNSSQSSPYSIHYSRRTKELFTIYANLPMDLLSHQSVLVLCAKTSSSACYSLTFIDIILSIVFIYIAAYRCLLTGRVRRNTAPDRTGPQKIRRGVSPALSDYGQPRCPHSYGEGPVIRLWPPIQSKGLQRQVSPYRTGPPNPRKLLGVRCGRVKLVSLSLQCSVWGSQPNYGYFPIRERAPRLPVVWQGWGDPPLIFWGPVRYFVGPVLYMSVFASL